MPIGAGGASVVRQQPQMEFWTDNITQDRPVARHRMPQSRLVSGI
jgi:hypothetical protein